jgi:phosphoserine aminotransferase
VVRVGNEAAAWKRGKIRRVEQLEEYPVSEDSAYIHGVRNDDVRGLEVDERKIAGAYYVEILAIV